MLSISTIRSPATVKAITDIGSPSAVAASTPGMKDTYTMFAGSYPDRIGNPDDPDDVDVQKLGVTTVDPRWHRTKAA